MADFINKIGSGLGIFPKKTRVVDPYGALNPEQRNVMQGLGPYFQNVINSRPETYQGQFSADITPEELASQANYNRVGALRNQSLSDIFSAGSDQGFDESFNREVADPSIDYFRRNIQPGIEEALPTFSIARGQVVGNKLADVMANLAQQRFAARQALRDQAINASGAFDAGGRTSMDINAVPRIIKQAGMDRQYADWARANEQKANSVAQMLQFLGIESVTDRPTEPTGFQKLWPYLMDIGNLAVSAIPGSGNTGSKNNTYQSSSARPTGSYGRE